MIGDKPPRFELSRILKARDKLFGLLEPRVGDVAAGEAFHKIAAAVAILVDASPNSRGVLETVLALPSTRVLSRKDLWLFAWRVAANAKGIAAGEPSRPWTSQQADEWVAFEILDIVPTRMSSGVAGYLTSLRAMSGSPCGMVVDKRWSRNGIGWRARTLGFLKKGRRPLPLQDTRLMVRLRFAALVLAADSSTEPSFRDMTMTSSLLAHNRELLKQRIRREPPCPAGFAGPCWECPNGYAVGDVVCPAATHPTPWWWAMCPTCGNEGWVDSAGDGRRCVACQRRKKGENRLG